MKFFPGRNPIIKASPPRVAAVFFLACLFTACIQEKAASPDLFATPAMYPVGEKPATVVAHDMNGDGNPDILVPNSGSQTLHYYEGLGDGTFKKARVMKTGREPVALDVNDFNGDGTPDIAVCNYGDDNISIFLGQKDGSFQVKDRVKAGRLPIALASADFNNDGKIDLAVTLRFDKLIILLGIGDGRFKLAETYRASGTPARMVVGDYNGDSNFDIAIVFNAIKANFIKIFYGNGDGTFQNPKRFTGGKQSSFITQFDMNLDGAMDLIIASPMADSLTLFLGDGNGGFHSMPDFAGEKSPQHIVPGEFTGDRFPDLVVCNRRDGSISILEGNGDGSFIFPHYNYPVGRNPRAIAGADFNNDGLQDLAVILYDTGQLKILMRTQGVFGSRQT